MEHAAEVRSALLSAIRQSERLEIRFGQDARIGLPIIQLVCAAHRMAHRSGCTIELSGNSCPQVTDAVAMAGFCGGRDGANATPGCVWNRRRP